MNILYKDFWDSKPNLFRVIIVILSTIFLFVSLWIVYSSISMPTDENVFADPISKYYVTQAIDTKSLKDNKLIKDKIHKGDLIVKINNKNPDSLWNANFPLNFTKDTARITLQVACIHRKAIENHIVNKSILEKKFFVKLKSGVLVISVNEGGASDRAGLKVGDIIIKINGKTFSSALDADLIMRNLKTDADFDYQILRNGKILDLKIRLAKYGISFSLFFFFLSGIFMMATGLFLGVLRPKLIAARLTSLALLFVGFSITGRINPTMHLLISNPHLFDLMLVITNAVFIFSFPIFIHSTYYFPVEKSPEFLKKKWIVFFPYIFSSIIFILAVYAIFSKDMPSSFSTYITLGMISGFIVFLIVLTRISKITNKNDKRISRPIYYTLYINLCSLGIMALISGLGFQSIYLSYLNLLILLIPAAYLYTIARYRLLDLNFRLKKNNQYLLLTSVWRLWVLFLFFACVWLFSHLHVQLPNIHFTGRAIEVLANPMKPEYVNFYNSFIAIILSLALAFVAIYIYRKGISFFNKKYFRPKFDYKQTTSQIISVIEKNYALDNLLMEIVQKLKETMLLTKAGIIIYNADAKGLNQYYSNLNDTSFELAIANNIILLNEATSQIAGNFRTEYLPYELKSLLLQEDFSMILPIQSKGNSMGAVFIGEKLSQTPINNEDLAFLQSFLAQVIIAIENAKLYEELAKKERMKHELELARNIQAASLPKFHPKVKGLDIASVSIPAFEVGGDFFDYLNDSDDEIMIVIGDVSGKGASAALYMSKVQGIMRTLAEFKLSTKEILSRANNLLYRNIEKKSFISALAARIDMKKNRITLSRAGHLPLLVYRAESRKVVEIKPKGMILGAAKDSFFRTNTEEFISDFQSGDIFLFATDGVVEAHRAQDEFGIDRLKALVSHFKALGAADLMNEIIKEIDAFRDDSYIADDLTLVVVKVS